MEIFNPNITGSVTLNGDTITTWPTGSGGGGSSPTLDFDTKTLNLNGATDVYGYQYYIGYTQFGYLNTGELVAGEAITLTNYSNLKNVGYNGLYYVGFSGSYDFPSLEVLGSYAMAFSRMTEFNAPNLKFANNFCLGGTTNMNTLVSASLGTSTTLEKMNGSVFSNQVNLAYVDISTLSTSSINNLGGSPANNSVFNNVASGEQFMYHYFLKLIIVDNQMVI